ncbi:DUF3592 domain-containing protein [Clostridium sp. AM58-1XD]|uniref:DUF3592 domain-containing protein n=1 Tax=Clostridium sp. AM58-1XD TaxID=2292307 RepID=UPI000E4B90DE|nr:DUF3592 domain-containing protein [Clostridium sp. AM58-1XD]RGY99098.1 hypothetical protein DXA13_09265 [Clostridium sp. AM58-1XD]
MTLIIIIICIVMIVVFALRVREAANLTEEIEKARKEYHGTAEAKVLEVETRRLMRTVYYYPLFLYEAEDRPYGESSTIFSIRKDDFKQGSKIEVRYDENRPSSFMIIPDEGLYQMAKDEKSSNYIAIIMAVVIMLLSIFQAVSV